MKKVVQILCSKHSLFSFREKLIETNISEDVSEAVNFLMSQKHIGFFLDKPRYGRDFFIYTNGLHLNYNDIKYSNSVFMVDADVNVKEKVNNDKNCFEPDSRPAVYRRNRYCEQTMYAIGGGDVNKLESAYKYVRCGGSAVDKFNYLLGYNSSSDKGYQLIKEEDLPWSDEEMFMWLFPGLIQGEQKIMTKLDVMRTIKINKDASPGYFLRQLGYNTKGECLEIMANTYSLLYDLITDGDSPNCRLIWTMASRPKLTTYEKALDRAKQHEAVGRVISLPDGIEQFILHPIWYPLLKHIQNLNEGGNINVCPVKIGIHRAGEHWKKLFNHMKSKYRWIYAGDWSQYDRRVPRNLIRYAIRVIKCAFDMNDLNTARYFNYFEKFYEENCMNSTYKVNKMLVERVGGVGSGSLFTSLIDSVTNAIALRYVLYANDVNDYEIGVYGDDHYILLNDFGKHRKAKQFIKHVVSDSAEFFGFKCSEDDVSVTNTSEMAVGYSRPIYRVNGGLQFNVNKPITNIPIYTVKQLKEGTRNKKPWYYEYSSEPFDDPDYNKGETHRWNYVFKNKPSFLSYYWRHDGMPIRPTLEVIARILNPERKITSLEDHEALLWSWLFENIWNSHSVNEIYHMLLDVMYMRSEMISRETTNLNDIDLKNKTGKYAVQFYLKPKSSIRIGDRMWFRRIDGYVEPWKVDINIKIHRARFLRQVKKLSNVYFKIHRFDEHYKIRDMFHNALFSKMRFKTNSNIDGALQSKMVDDLINDIRTGKIENEIFMELNNMNYTKYLNPEDEDIIDYGMQSQISKVYFGLLNSNMNNNYEELKERVKMARVEVMQIKMNDINKRIVRERLTKVNIALYGDERKIQLEVTRVYAEINTSNGEIRVRTTSYRTFKNYWKFVRMKWYGFNNKLRATLESNLYGREFYNNVYEYQSQL